MNERKLFQIGEVAKLFHISVGTLRHYEKAGLLRPERTDEKTGYRYYSVRQFEALNTIRYLRVLGMPLEQITDFLRNKDVHVMEEKLQKQKESIAQKKRELEAIERKIDHRLRQLSDACAAPLDMVRLTQAPDVRIVWIQGPLTIDTYLDLEYPIRQLAKQQMEPIVFLGKVGVGISKKNLDSGKLGQYDLVFLVLDEEDLYQGAVEQLPKTLCASIYFRGSHNEAPAYYRKLLDYIHEEHLEISGFSREITLIDNGFTSDPEKFVTEIQIPVRDKRII